MVHLYRSPPHISSSRRAQATCCCCIGMMVRPSRPVWMLLASNIFDESTPAVRLEAFVEIHLFVRVLLVRLRPRVLCGIFPRERCGSGTSQGESFSKRFHVGGISLAYAACGDRLVSSSCLILRRRLTHSSTGHLPK